ncbi:unnamed protein product [marine sediment metagenome]|uniref:Uncharacterized protein n=1 Tax=marine sediment metagenome TaxID=412755 RepID=X1SHA4_9ZZZZ
MVQSDIVTVTVEEPVEYPLAPEYDRVHFVGTALFNIGITEKRLNEHADEAMKKLEEKVGYRVFLVDIKVEPHGAWTDVDFIMDVPYGYEQDLPVQGLPVTLYIAAFWIIEHWKLILAGIIVLGFIIWIFWTVWIEKSKIYHCDQCPDFPAFQGYDQWLAHLAAFHPEKYEAAADDPWWEQLMELAKYIPWVVGGLVTIAALATVRALARRS